MYKKILAPLDGSELAECILPNLESIAEGCGVREIVFLRVVEPLETRVRGYGDYFSEAEIKRIESEAKAAATKYLGDLVSRTRYHGVNVQSEVVTGKPAESIIEYVNKNEVDLIVIATHGRSGISRWVWGSVADRVLHSASVPVLMVRPRGCGVGN
jgi:nucleotide-binding universal stress UspA family protein